MTIAYHGSRTHIRQFRILSETGKDQFGPGIYFSSNIKDAEGYGPLIHIVELNLAKFVNSKSRVDAQKVVRLCSKASATTLTNWDENRLKAQKLLQNSVLNRSPSMAHATEEIWSEVFQLDNVKACAAFVAEGIDGRIELLPSGDTFYMVFNPNVIRILDVQRV